jgi:hypothetical protein
LTIYAKKLKKLKITKLVSSFVNMYMTSRVNAWVWLVVDLAAGVFVDKDFKSKELVLRKTPLIGAQYSRHKVFEMFNFQESSDRFFKAASAWSLNYIFLILVLSIFSEG